MATTNLEKAAADAAVKESITCSGVLGGHANRIRGVIGELRPIHQGAAADATSAAFEDAATRASTLSRRLEEIANLLGQGTASIVAKDEELTANISRVDLTGL